MKIHTSHGFTVIEVALVVTVIALFGGAGFYYFHSRPSHDASTTASSTTQTTNNQAIVETKPTEPDSADSLTSPQKVTSKDGKTYFYYGAPAGQNNKETKRIIISLPGHGTSAESDYAAWQSHLTGGQYALASFNWWDGEGETTADYYEPKVIVPQVEAFLSSEGYASRDIVILEGFSRGSANTYAVIANDRLSSPYTFDAVISNAGKYQSSFPLTDKSMSDTEITGLFKNVPWVLACGGIDPNPDRDGCEGMAETKSFLTAHGANVLGTVTDPNLGHGAFHMSTLGLPKQALDLIEAAL